GRRIRAGVDRSFLDRSRCNRRARQRRSHAARPRGAQTAARRSRTELRLMRACRVFVTTIVMATAAGCRPHADVREARDFERMRVQQRYDAYGRSQFFPNGAVLQPPPANTIDRPAAYATQATLRSLAFFSGRSDTAFVTDIPVAIDGRLRAVGA